VEGAVGTIVMVAEAGSAEARPFAPQALSPRGRRGVINSRLGAEEPSRET